MESCGLLSYAFEYQPLANGKVEYKIFVPVNTMCRFLPLGSIEEHWLTSGEHNFIVV